MGRKDSQLAVIRAALLKGQVITPLDALNMCGCFRLSARIYDLRHDEGLEIEMITEDGDKRYAKYFISPANLAKYNCVA